MSQDQPKAFKQKYTLQRRKKIYNDVKTKNQNSFVVVIEKSHKYQQILPQLAHCRFVVNKGQSMLDLLKAVKERLVLIDVRCKTQSVHLMINNKILDQQSKIEELHNLHKDEEDEILYITYSNVQSF